MNPLLPGFQLSNAFWNVITCSIAGFVLYPDWKKWVRRLGLLVSVLTSLEACVWLSKKAEYSTMRFIYLLFFFLGSSACVTGQQYQQDRMRDFQWISGTNFQNHPLGGRDGFTLDFASLPPTVGYQLKPIDFYLCNGNISSREGILQFYSNGARIIGPTHEVMQEGEHVDWGTQSTAIGDKLGSPYQGGVLILPAFDADSTYYMLYTAGDLTGDIYGSIGLRLNLAEIDMRLNAGLGRVVFKDITIISDSLDYGKLVACRHANGRDWWIIVPRWEQGSFRRMLYDPQGFHDLGIQAFPDFLPFMQGFGNAVFSPDGTKYAIINTFKSNKPDTSFLFQFDRCTGLLSAPLLVSQASDSVYVPNFCFSPNSRYLYKTTGKRIYQYDTESADLNASRQLVAVADGYVHIQQSLFMQMQLAPDGKIYVTSRSAAPFLHRIDYPDRPGPACQVIQHCLDSLVATTFCIPSFPHFRLGPLDGSPCDTLGIDNLPWARFRYAQDDAQQPMAVQFTDLTAFEPAYWHWSFGEPGNNNMSTERHPVHVYAQPGLYEVCLRAGNDYGADSICRVVQVLSAAVGSEEVDNEVGAAYRIFPNPTTGDLTVQGPDLTGEIRSATLYNAIGQPVMQTTFTAATNRLALQSLPAGSYWLSIREAGRILCQQLMVKR